MKPGYAILDHPADLGIEAVGNTHAEAFEQAAHALMSVILDPSRIACREERSVSVSASDGEHLLVRWLSEVLYLFDGERFAGGGFRVVRFSPTSLEAVVRGETFRPDRHTTRLDVKAVTYHQLAVTERDGGVVLRVVLDI